MAIDILTTFIAAIVATIIWFFIGAIVYMNPFVAKIYTHYEDDPTVKNRKNLKTFLINTFVFSIFIQSILFAFVYAYIQPILPGTLYLNTLYFGIILILLKILPRFFDMWVQSKYPTTLLFIEIINGAIGSFVMAFIFVFII